MVSNDINHQVHPPRMESSRQRFEISSSAESAIEGIYVLSPVSMVRRPIGAAPSQILHDGRDPDLLRVSSSSTKEKGSIYSSEAHVLDIIEMVDNSLPGAATIDPIPCVASRGR